MGRGFRLSRLLFWAVLAAMVFSSAGLTCERSGDTRLAALELEVEGVNRLAFVTSVRAYDLWLPSGATTVTIRAEAYDPDARVNWYAPDCQGHIDSGLLGVGGGEAAVDLPPDGCSLYIGVIAPGGASNTYIVAIRPECPVGYVCDDGNDCTTDQCNPPNYMSCQQPALPDGTSCNFAGGSGECIAGSCEDAPGWGVPDSWVTPEFIAGTSIHLSPSGVAVAEKLVTTFPGPDPYEPVLCRDASQLVPGEGWSDSTTRIDCLGPRVLRSYLGIDAQGNALHLTSWLFRGLSTVTLSAHRFTPGNGWVSIGAPELGTYGGHEKAFRAAMADDGSLTLIWAHGPWTQPALKALRFTPTDGWGGPGGGNIAEVRAPTGSVAVGPNGHAIALWATGSPGERWSSSLDLASGWGPAELVGVPTAPALQVNGSGRALAVWMQNDAGVETVWAKRYTPSFGWGAAEQFERDDLTSVGLPLVQLDDVGDGLAVWIQSDQVWANTLTASGWGVPQRIDRGGTQVASNLRFDMNPAGEAIATWVQEDAGVYSIRWTRFTPDIGWRPSKVFEDVGATSSYSPSTRIAEDGTAIMLWFRDGMTWMSRFE